MGFNSGFKGLNYFVFTACSNSVAFQLRYCLSASWTDRGSRTTVSFHLNACRIHKPRACTLVFGSQHSLLYFSHVSLSAPTRDRRWQILASVSRVTCVWTVQILTVYIKIPNAL
jgi:hypothetical protein